MATATDTMRGRGHRGIDGRWDSTFLMEQRLGNKLKKRFFFFGKLRFEDRFVIHRNSRIDGGVSLGSGAREAIVVDSRKYPGINRLYAILRSRMGGRDTVLSSVYDLVDQMMEYDEPFVLNVARQYPDQKVSLDYFIQNKKGVCRHMGLLCGVLLEKIRDHGIIRGKVSIDRNSIPMVGGHAFCRYTNSAGDIFILDVARHFLGKLDKEESHVKIDGYHIWDYYRPEE